MKALVQSHQIKLKYQFYEAVFAPPLPSGFDRRHLHRERLRNSMLFGYQYAYFLWYQKNISSATAAFFRKPKSVPNATRKTAYRPNAAVEGHLQTKDYHAGSLTDQKKTLKSVVAQTLPEAATWQFYSGAIDRYETENGSRTPRSSMRCLFLQTKNFKIRIAVQGSRTSNLQIYVLQTRT